MSLKAVLFDLDDTLLIDEAVSRECFLAAGDLVRHRVGVDDVRFIADAERIAKKHHREGPLYPLCYGIGISAFECLWGDFGTEGEWGELNAWCAAYRRDVWGLALREQGVKDDAFTDELCAFWARERRARQTLMPHAEEVLATLQGRYRLGLLTNGSPGLQREKIAFANFGTTFDAIAVSGEVGVGKPKPGIFEWLLERLETGADEAVMIGNSLERDIAGAHNAGVRSVYIVSADRESDSAHKPDHVIHGLLELLPLIENL